MKSLFFPAALIALVAQLAVVWAVVAGRAPASSSRVSARWAELAWVILPTLFLIGTLYLTWNRIGEPIAVAPAAGVPA
jgi:TRAP-type mannitol/chloroaromatic compound transport system permease small subunit